MVSTAQIKTIQDIMRKDRGINGDAQRIEQLVWMIFLKVLDDREQEYELLDDKYRYVSKQGRGFRWKHQYKANDVTIFLHRDTFGFHNAQKTSLEYIYQPAVAEVDAMKAKVDAAIKSKTIQNKGKDL